MKVTVNIKGGEVDVHEALSIGWGKKTVQITTKDYIITYTLKNVEKVVQERVNY